MKNDIQLLNVDCLQALPTISTGSVDMILSDLPYGTTANKWDSVISLSEIWSEFLRVTNPTAVIALTASQPFTSALVMCQPTLFRHEWIWQKSNGTNFLNAKREPMRKHETVLVFSRGKWTYNPQPQELSEAAKKLVGKTITQGRHSANYGAYKKGYSYVQKEFGCPSTIQHFKSDRGLHPTQKPVDLMRYLIRTY
jgi:site-specific DNA-methyltransferase (adenine-specific)